ncbi:atrial natriuretic peptide-converting enzyme-like [Wyeomyia smithii]|uniref:atrial natriuretic peptide-converting enzyme-like n=1 Tax=Wyeomyia smithii TaxID=174621 RepID=UPI002467C453|nr:atrial natriuretic peptide-converting enzyme-like [Wyeomyia smithii]
MGFPVGRESRRLLLTLLLQCVLACNTAEVIANDSESCLNGDGFCVPDYLCDNGRIILYGEELIDVRVGVNQQCSPGLVCCQEESYNPPLQVDLNLVDSDNESFCEGMCVPSAKCPEFNSESVGSVDLRFNSGICPSNQICCRFATGGCTDGVCTPIEQCEQADAGINLRFNEQNCPFNHVCCKSPYQTTEQSSTCKGECVPLFQCKQMLSASSLINLRISDECPPGQVCCEDAAPPACAGTCTDGEFCADSPPLVNLRFMDDACPGNQICCLNLKPARNLSKKCDGECVSADLCPGAKLTQSDSMKCPSGQVCCELLEDINRCEGTCVSQQECDDVSSKLEISSQKCPKNQVCCKNKKSTPHSCDGQCVALHSCPKMAQSSSIDLRFSNASCPANQVCCNMSLVVESCDGVCIPAEDCADSNTSLINLRAISGNCPLNTQCCKHPVATSERAIVNCTCVPFEQCTDVDLQNAMINLRATSFNCPHNQICCKQPQKTECKGMCIPFNQCQTPVHEINLRFTDNSCPKNQICCTDTRTSQAIVPLTTSCEGICVVASQCARTGSIDLRLMGEGCPIGQICCSQPIALPISKCNGRCIRIEQCPQYDKAAMINLRFTSDGCPFDQVCCQSSLPPGKCDGVCTPNENCDDNLPADSINLRNSYAYCSDNQICCKKLKTFLVEECQCVPVQQCSNRTDASSEINLRNTFNRCPAGQICCTNSDTLGVTSPRSKSTCDGRCVFKQYCPELAENPNEINLRQNDDRCPRNQICCRKPQLSIPSTDLFTHSIPGIFLMPSAGPASWSLEEKSQAGSDTCSMNSDPRTSVLEKRDVPWLASIWSRHTILGIEKSRYECVGSLLKPNLILTSADCLANLKADQIYARIGDFNLKPLNTLSKRREYAIAAISIHPDYKAQSGQANVAVLTLSKNSTSKSSVCLSQYSEKASDSDCFLIGWSKLAITNDDIANAVPEKHLLKLETAQPNCPEELLCTDRVQSEVNCDSFQGTPLVCFAQGSRSWKLFGIATGASTRCDRSAIPNSLTSIGAYEMWIREQISPSFMQIPMVPKPNRLYLPALP